MSKVKGNIGVERVVLAGLCQHGKEAFYDVCDIVSSNTFSLDSNQVLYKCIEKVLTQIDKPDTTSILASADSLGLSEFLTKNKVDIEYIRSLFNFPIKLENVRPHAKQLAKLEIIRKEYNLLFEAQRELDNFDGTESIDKILGVGENAVFALANELNSRNEDSPKQIVDGAKARLDELAKAPIKNIGIPTPWAIYNKIIGGGIRPGVAIWAARPKQGKSTAAIKCGLHVANLGIKTLYIDTEMVKEEQENRIIANHSDVDVDLIETGNYALYDNYRLKVDKSIETLSKVPFYHKWVGGQNFEEIISIMRRWLYSVVGFNEFGKPNPHFVIYDYFKLMDTGILDKMQEYQAIGFQISRLSDFCKQYGTPCLSFVQLNRDGITKDSSDIISQSDRLLWLCTSCAVFKKISFEEAQEAKGFIGNRRLSILESRYGEPLDDGDYICMNFNGKKANITELGTKYNILKNKQNDSGFEIDDSAGDNNIED